MNGIKLEPGLREAFNQQTHQRLLSEATRARMAKCVITEDPNLSEAERYSLRMKIKIIAQVIQEAASTIVAILKTNNRSMNA